MGTKDGYLNLAISLLEVVAACENQPAGPIELERVDNQRAFWSDHVKRCVNQLPGDHAYIVGSYLYDDHQSFLAALENSINPSLHDGAQLRNDPAFKEP